MRCGAVLANSGWIAVALAGCLSLGAQAQTIEIIPLDDDSITLAPLDPDDPNADIGLDAQTAEELGLGPSLQLSDEQFQTFEQQTQIEVADAGRLRVLDKMTGQTTDLNLLNAESAEIGRIFVTLHECRYPAESPSSDAFARLSVTSTDGADLFTGWMIASSPALMALDHPRYDVWVLGCTQAPDDDLPEVAEDVEVEDQAAPVGERAVLESIRPRPRP